MTQPFALPADIQRLVNEPFSEPPPRARAHWKQLAKATERLDSARARQTAYDAEVMRLNQELVSAKQRDDRALGDALANDEPEPEPEADAIEKEIERNTQRSSAMIGVVRKEQRAVSEIVARHKGRWLDDLRDRHLPDRAAAYRLAVAELERARAELVADVNLGAWLAMYPATGGQPPTANLPATPDLPDHVAGPTFTEVLGALRRDVEQLPQRGPVRLSDKALRDLDRKKILIGSVDAEGDHHVQVFEGDTDAGWRVRDWLARETKK